MRTLIVAAGLIAASAGAALAQDVGKGEHTFSACAPCHSVGQDAQNKLGPELNGLDGRKAGIVPGFNYSADMKNSGIVWNAATFKQFMKDPKAMIAGTAMFFAGFKNEQDINDLWAYVSQFTADGSIKK
ncbi:MAG: c-type cytochrome [Xanthobacteraceae bacterium]